MTTEQLSLLEGDLLSQRVWVLRAIVADAVQLLTSPTTGLWAIDRGLEEHLLLVLRDAASELRKLPDDGQVPF